MNLRLDNNDVGTKLFGIFDSLFNRKGRLSLRDIDTIRAQDGFALIFVDIHRHVSYLFAV